MGGTNALGGYVVAGNSDTGGAGGAIANAGATGSGGTTGAGGAETVGGNGSGGSGSSGSGSGGGVSGGGKAGAGGSGAVTGGAATGGLVTGGAVTGGAATGGTATGGVATYQVTSSQPQVSANPPTGDSQTAPQITIVVDDTGLSAGAYAATGGQATGGAVTGGAATGGQATGGAGTGGARTGGQTTGGAGTGGARTGGQTTGGAGTGGATTGGTTGACAVSTPLTGGTKYCSSTTGTLGDGVGYSVWLSDSTTGTNCGTFYNVGAAFKAQWNMASGGDLLTRAGLSWNSDKTYDQLGTVSADYAYTKTGISNTNVYTGIYGWSVSPLVEFYIVEEWIGFNPGSNATKKGTFTVDGGTYDVYTHTQTNQPSIQGTATFQQFFSVRQSARQCGHISISAHFKEWASLGMTLGKMFEAKLLVEAMGGSGTIDFTNATVVAN